ncbi:hypothetical protein [Pseudomonas abietaniphila]
MQPVNRITLVLRAKEGETLAPLLQHISLGAPVAVGTGVAIIAGASDRDAFETAFGDGEFCIDTHARLALDAARYRWLRDRDRVEDADSDLVAARDRDCFYGAALDREIDEGMRLESLVKKHGEIAQ